MPEETQTRLADIAARAIPSGAPFYTRLRISDWSSAVDHNLTSSLFDIEANIRDGDSRAGLDTAGVEEVHQIMQQHGVVRIAITLLG